MQNQYPTWKYILILLVLVLGIVYAIPNLYVSDPSVQVSGVEGNSVSIADLDAVKQTLTQADIAYKDIKLEQPNLLVVRFVNTDVQLKARDYIKAALPAAGSYSIALNLASSTPSWLEGLGAHSMKLGLDLRGGVHLLLNVDAEAVIDKQLQSEGRSFAKDLRDARIRYTSVRTSKGRGVEFSFKDQDDLDKAYSVIKANSVEYFLKKDINQGRYSLIVQMTPEALLESRQRIMERTMTVLRNRINELGVNEPIVQQQSESRIAVDLPGVQDAAQAKQILGGTATLEFHMVDSQHDLNAALAGDVPLGSRIYKMKDGTPILLYNDVVLKGDSITDAKSTFGQDGGPVVNIRASGSGVTYFHRITQQNVGKRMAIVYVETKNMTQLVDGKPVHIAKKQESVISAPVINSALGGDFQITGLTDQQEAMNLALLLRAGALPANMYIVEESTVGPSLGKDNIDKGLNSILIALALVILLMLAYYRLFGLIANIALIMNVVIVVSLLSILNATLTLPGIAGLLLTVGMAVDANVLIFERIREELRNGTTPQAAIYAGYEKAFSTIVDSNVTTLIAAVALFSLGSGPIKGFAVTLTLGILTSMFTAITGTRAIVNLIYGKRAVKKLSIGI